MNQSTGGIGSVLAVALCACTVGGPGEDDVGRPYAGSAAYQGCFTDESNRALPQYYGVVGSVQSCIDSVAADGYRYAGLQWFGECWGGHDLGYRQDSDSECNTPCSSGETCGGAWHNSIFEIAPEPPRGPVCGDGVCTPGVEDCGLCTGDCPCRSGTHCENRQCVEDGNGGSGGANLPFGAQCSANEECATGRCELIHQHGRRCTLSCNADADCPAGELPRNGGAQKCNARRICRP